MNTDPTDVLVLGVGGAGLSTVSYLCEHQVEARCVVAGIDAAALKASLCPAKLFLGEPGLDSRALRIAEHKERIADVIRGSRLVILVSGMAGNTAGPAAVELACLIQGLGIRVLCLAFMPLQFERADRKEQARQRLEELWEASVWTAAVSIYDFAKGLPTDVRMSEAFGAISQAVLELINRLASLLKGLTGPIRGADIDGLLQDSALATSTDFFEGQGSPLPDAAPASGGLIRDEADEADLDLFLGPAHDRA